MNGHNLLNLAIDLAALGCLMMLWGCGLAVNDGRRVRVLLVFLAGAFCIFAAVWFATEAGRAFEREQATREVR